MCAPPSWYRALLATDRVTFHRADGDIETLTEIAVVPEDSAEVRRVTVINNSDERREIELTSYGEIVLAPDERDRAHPAFSNLFVETEYHEWCTAITATRRPRSATEQPLWCAHVVDAGKERIGPVTYETDRARFLGRGRTTREPVSLESDGALPWSQHVDDAWKRGDSRFHDTRRHLSRASLRARGSLSRSIRGTASAGVGLDVDAGGAARARCHARRRRGIPRPRRPSLLRESQLARVTGRVEPESRVATDALGARHLGRLADRARDPRVRGGTADAPPALRGASLLAAPRNEGRSGDSQCPWTELSPGAQREDRRDDVHGHRLSGHRSAGRGVREAPRSDGQRRPPHAARDGATPHSVRRPYARHDRRCVERCRS